MSGNFASDYIDVATRLAEFRAQYPHGSLQPADPSQPFQILEVGGKTRLVVVAAAYRTPDDPRPGIGMAYEEVPGRTPYTRDSELQNAETSAWGRAIVAVLAADTKKGIASADEVRNRQADRDVQVEKPRTPAKKAERVKQVPEDEFMAPTVEQAPPPPPETRKTDQQWFDGWLQRVIGCESLAELKGLWSECTEQHRIGKLTTADLEQATDAKNTQKAAIERASADWPEVAKPGAAA